MTPDAPPDGPVVLQPAMLKIDPLSGDLGSVTVGNSPSTTAFTITNVGEETSGTIQAVVSGANASDFIATNACSTLEKGDTCTVTVTFNPSAAGAKTGLLSVNASPGGSVMASLAGQANKPGQLTLTTAASQALGTVTVGSTSATSATFTVKNTGTEPTGALLATLTGSDVGEFTVTTNACNGAVLQPNATCDEVLTFAPLSAGAKTASITVTGAPGGSVIGAVSGTGVNAAHLVVNPTLLPFGNQLINSTSGAQTVTVTNNGGVASSAITLPITGTNPGAFAVVPGGSCGAALAAGASCSFNVKFAPTVAGDNSATLTVTAATGGSQAVALSGTGTMIGAIQVSDVPFAFNPTNVGALSASHTFTVTNTGGTTTSPITVALGGTSPDQFTVVAGSNGCNTLALAPAQSCTIAIQFAPTLGGTQQASINVTSSLGTVAGAISGAAVAPAALAIAPPSRDFGSVVVNTTSSPLTFTVSNTGGVTSAVPALTVTGANASEFTAMGCTAALAAAGTAGDTCTVSVIYTPTIAGPKSAAVVVTAGTASVTGALSASAITFAQLVPNPTTITFPGFTLISESAGPLDFSVTNNGAQTTSAITVTTTGPFSQTNNCTTLVTGNACTVRVTYTPTVSGNSVGTVHVTATTGGSFDVSLSGVAKNTYDITSPASATDRTFDFDSTQVDPDTVPPQLFVIHNNDGISHMTSIALTAGTATTVDSTSPFNGDINLIASSCTGTLAANSDCTFSLTFDPQSVGAKLATVTFSQDGTTDAAHRVVLTVRGTATVSTLGIGIDTACLTLPCSPTPATLGTTPAAGTVAYNYGALPVGTSGSTRRFYIGNTSGSSTGVLNTTVTGNSFAITSNTCAGATLAGSGQCFVDVTYFPAAAGTASATLTVSATNTLGGAVVATLSGTGSAAFSTISPTALPFGTVFVGETATAITQKTITITNNSGQVESLGLAFTGDPTFTRNGGTCAATLSSGMGTNSCTIIVRFTPTLATPLAKAGTLTITETPASGFGGTVTAVALTGTARSTIVISPTAATLMDTPVGGSASQAFLVTNQSMQTISGLNVNSGGDAQFVVLSNTCGTLAGSMTCGFNLQFTPTVATTTPLVATITVGGTNGSAVATVTATAITAASITNDRNVNNLALGSVIIGQSSPTASIVYSNVGTELSGVPVITATGATADFTLTYSCTAKLGGASTCAVMVKFNPTAAGARSIDLRVDAAPGTTAGGFHTAVTGTGLVAGDVAVAPSYVRFANTAQSSTTGPKQVFIFSNTSPTVGSKALTALTVGAGFAIDTTAGATTCVAGTTTLNVGATCQVTVQFKPTTAGEQRGVLSATFGGQIVDAALEGFSLSSALVTATPGSSALAFGDQIVTTTSAAQIIVLKNTGGVPAGISGTATLTGLNTPDFVVGTGCNGVTLAAGATCSITVAFKPVLPLVRTATLTVPAFAGFAGATYSLTGVGVSAALLSLDITTPFDFTPGAVPVVAVGDDVSSAPVKMFTIANNSGTAVSGAIAITLSNSTDFEFVAGANPCNLTGTQTLGMGDTCNVYVRFAPEHLGVSTSTLGFNSPQGGMGSVMLSGTAVQAGMFTTTANADLPSQNFGSAGAGDTATLAARTKVIRFNNRSDSALGLVTTAITGTDFDILADGCAGRPLAAGGSCDITVLFVPSGTASANRTGSLTASGLVQGTSFTTTDSVALTAHVDATP